MTPRTLFAKLWDAHVVHRFPGGGPALLYVDLHLVHEVTSPQAFAGLRQAGRRVRRPELTVATVDHNVPTGDRALPIEDPVSARQLDALAVNAREFGVELFDLRSPSQGIVHVIGPEQGFTQPGMIIVCGDSHTSTHGAFGALAVGIGTSEVEHVLATQCLVWSEPRTMEARLSGAAGPGVTAKDLILALIGSIGTAGATGHVIEYTGDAIRALSMEQRMTVCNMSIEAGARAGMIAPDETTFTYLAGRPRAPTGAAWTRAVAAWRGLQSDPGATYDRRVTLDAARPISRPTTNDAPCRGRSSIWAWRPAPPSRDCRSIGCSWAPAPTAGSRICARRPGWCRAGASRRAYGRWSCPGRSRYAPRRSARGSTGCSARPDSSGATPGARCAWG